MSFVNRLRSTKGFTLIELLITVVILAILAAVVYSTLAPNKDTAKASRAIAAVQDAYQQAQSWAAVNGDFTNFANSKLTGQLTTTALDTTKNVAATTNPNDIAIIGTPGTSVVVCANATKIALYCIKDDGSKTTYGRFDDTTKTIAAAAGTNGANVTGDKWVN